MEVTRQRIADAGMVSKAKVHKDIERGNLDPESLKSVAAYVIQNLLMAGGCGAVTGLCPDGREDEPEIFFEKSRIIDGFIPSYDDGQDQG